MESYIGHVIEWAAKVLCIIPVDMGMSDMVILLCFGSVC